MPITPDDFDWEPPAAPEPPVAPSGIPIYQPPPARISPAAPVKRGTPGWVKLLAILAILFMLFSLASNGEQPREERTTDTAVIDTMVTAMPHPQLQRGVRRYTPNPFHLPTWASGPAVDAAVDMVLTSVIVRDHETLVTFDIRSDYYAAILYDQLYLIIDGATTLRSTSGLEGGRQSRFDDVGRVRRIDILPGESVVLVARFPQLPDDAKTLKFASPRLEGRQSGWAWEGIELREITVFPEEQ